MIAIACLSTALLHGMEDQNSLSFPIGKTVVKLTKGCMYDADGTVDLMVVGRVQQQQLKNPSFGDLFKTGLMFNIKENIVYIKNEGTDDSASDDDTYKPYPNPTTDNKKLWEHAHTKRLQNRVISIIEPRIAQEDGSYSYYYNRNSIEFEGDAALEQASTDLALCYNKLLDIPSIKDIAIAPLGTDVGFPRDKAAPIAVETIVKAIKNNPDKFASIHLFVKKRSEFALYTELLKAHATEQK